MTEKVVHPNHYGGKENPHEPIKIIEHYNLNFALGNVVKYMLRAGKKSNEDELTDLMKAKFYLDRHIDNLEMKLSFEMKPKPDKEKPAISIVESPEPLIDDLPF